MNDIEKVSPEETLNPVGATEAAETDKTAAETVSYHSMTREQLLEAMEKIIGAGDMEAHRDVASIKQAYFSLRTKEAEAQLAEYVDGGGDPATFTAQADPGEQRLKELMGEFRQRRASWLEEQERRREANLASRLAIIEKLRSLTEDIDNIGHRFPEFQQLQADFRNVGEVPPGRDNDTWKSYQLVVEQFYDALKMNKELRDLDFRKNLEAKRQLIEQAKDLAGSDDVVEAFRNLQSLHDEWRSVGPVAKELREEIWEEFKAASTVVNKRHQEFFETRKAEELANEERKEKLCQEIEALDMSQLKGFAAWDEATRKVLDMQARWKETGFATRKNNARLFTRFREAADAFFKAKSEFFRQTKEELNGNLALKQALCDRAEALRKEVEEDKEDIRKAMDRIVAMQTEWKTIGSVPRRQSDAVWQRFTEACNYFFDRRKKETAGRRKEENDNLAAKRDVIERLKAIPADIERKDGIEQVRALQAEWQNIGHVPFRMKDKLYEEYRSACDALFDSFDHRESRNRISRYEGRLDSIKGDDRQMGRERDRLLRAIEGKRQELATYENNLGFFNVKSSAGNSMVKDIERKCARIKEEIREIEEKIRLLDAE